MEYVYREPSEDCTRCQVLLYILPPQTNIVSFSVNPYDAEIFDINQEIKGFFHFEIISIILISSFRFN